MVKSKKVLTALTAVAVALLLAACATTVAGVDGDASTLGTSSKLSWSYGSARLSGQVSGIGSTDVAFEGLAAGFYPVVCRNTQANPNDKDGNIAPGHTTSASSFNGENVNVSRNGVARFGGTKGQDFIIPNPPAEDISADTKLYCPNTNNWIAEADTTVFYITDIFLRYGTDVLGGVDGGSDGLIDSEDAVEETMSWTCITTATGSTPPATLSCTRDNPTREIDWSIY